MIFYEQRLNLFLIFNKEINIFFCKKFWKTVNIIKLLKLFIIKSDFFLYFEGIDPNSVDGNANFLFSKVFSMPFKG